jgi:hypothetical protein
VARAFESHVHSKTIGLFLDHIAQIPFADINNGGGTEAARSIQASAISTRPGHDGPDPFCHE